MPQTNAKVAIELYVDDKGTLRVKEFARESSEAFRQTEQAGSGAAGKLSAAWEGAKGMWGWVAAGAAAALTALTALVVTSGKEAKELEILARTAKMGADEFKAYAYATQSVGVSTEKLADISKDVQDKLGDFIATGGGEFADFFENVAPKVGLTAQALQQLSGPDALIAVKQAMDDANVSAAEQTFYMEAIADDASLLIPLLEDGGKALKDQAARAKELGVALSEIDNRNLAEAGGAASELGSAFGGLKNAVAAEFAPIFTDVMRLATELIVDAKDEARAFAGVFVNVAESFKGWKAVFDGRLGFFEFAKMDAKEFDVWLAKNAETSTKMADESVKGQGRYQKQIQSTTNSIKEQEKAQQKIIDQQKSEAEQQAEAEREMYEEAGLGADKYYSQEATELVQKAARWKKAGADVIEVDKWLYDELGKLSAEAWAKGETAAGQSMDSIQAMSETVVDQFDQANSSVQSVLEEMGIKIDELDGTEIGLSARFDGSAVVSGIDALVEKFKALRMAANAAATAPAPSSAPTSGSTGAGSSSAAETTTDADFGSYAGGGSTIVNNFNQQLSKSDVTAIISEQKRLEARK